MINKNRKIEKSIKYKIIFYINYFNYFDCFDCLHLDKEYCDDQ